jgi:subtilisin family serine protease
MMGMKVLNWKYYIPLVLLTTFSLIQLVPLLTRAQESTEEYAEDELILKFKPNLPDNAIQNILRSNDLTERRFLRRLGLMTVRIGSAASLNTVQNVLSRRPDIEYVEKNYVVQAFDIPNDPLYGNQYHLPRIDAPIAWDYEKGNSNAIIAVLDTGIYAGHPDLSGKVLVSDGFNAINNTSNTEDDNGHGTHVGGTAAANTNNSTGVAGVCHECLLLPVKVLDENGSGFLSDTIEGIDYVTNYAIQNSDIKLTINLSLGRTCTSGPTQSEQDAINNAVNNGVTIFAAAGNTGSSVRQCPASADNVIAVSATDQNDNFASFSSYGSYVDVAGPGVDIFSTEMDVNVTYGPWYWCGFFRFCRDQITQIVPAYGSGSGTSFSTPIAAGIAGLVFSANPSLTNYQVEGIIEDTADDLGAPGWDQNYGWGRVNAYGAVQEALFGVNPPQDPCSVDTDGDGTFDCDDSCPDDPDKTDPGVCGCDTSDIDTDGDGTPDCNDGCINDTNKTDPGQCGCGVPDEDSDSDGTADCNDGCTNDPDKTEPGQCGCGSAETDSDGDGTPDCNDGCPNDAGKTSPGVCACGTPDTDSDGDGTPDCNDGCPSDPGKTSPGICGCGTSDGDSDGDGTIDCNDGCPSDPGKTSPGVCGCGTSDADSDGDGTLDCNDGCPNDPSETSPGVCGCGIPDTDSDGDGTADCNDNCPSDAGKVSPGACGCGTPDIDGDGDGTADCNDNCPSDPGKVNPGVCGCGTPDTDSDGDGTPNCNDGCPSDGGKTLPGVCGCGTSDVDSDGNGTPDCLDPPSATDTTPPQVQITQPYYTYYTYVRTVTASASATDNVGIANVKFFVNGQLAATDTTSPYSTSVNLGRGNNTVQAVATDTSGNTSSDTKSVYVRF